jgi:hypothetical protein
MSRPGRPAGKFRLGLHDIRPSGTGRDAEFGSVGSARGLTGVVGRWSAGQPWTVIAAWADCMVILLLTGHLGGSSQLPSSQMSAGESYQAHPGHAGPGARRPCRSHRRHGRHRGLQHPDGAALWPGLRFRPPARLLPAARSVEWLVRSGARSTVARLHPIPYPRSSSGGH